MTVSFENGPSRTFDAVIGADGLHLAVRRVAFGEDSKFERPMGYAVAAFETSGYPLRDELVYLMYTEGGVSGRSLFPQRRANDVPFHLRGSPG